MGRFWTGSLEDGERDPVGRLYRLNPDRSVHLVDRGFYCPNGIDWSPDARSMYFVDSRADVVYRYSFDAKSGQVGERRRFLDTSAMDGIPDGLCVDADGNVWIAFWDGEHVSRFGPDGAHQIRIDVPVTRPTSVALGGADLRDLFITSARTGLSPSVLAATPDAGSLFVTRVDVAGLAPHYFPLAEGWSE
jgi:sugar lactone lactonase YvrE